MGLESFKYIVCDNEKRPLHSFNETKTYNEVKNEPNLGIKLEEPYVIIDIDDEEQFEILCKIINKLHIKTRILKTSRGGHFWFRTMTPMKNVIKSNTPLTLEVDVKSWGKNSMEFVKKDNVWREWLQYDEVVDTLPFFLRPISTKKCVLHYKEGDGRDDALFTYIIPLINNHLSKEEIKIVFHLINEYIFDDPLQENEIEKMFSDNKIFEKTAALFYDGRKFLHNKFADYLISEYHIKGYGGEVYFYYKDRYTNSRDILYSKMLEILPELVQNNLKETYENIRLKVTANSEKLNSEYVNVKNGLYNLVTKEFINHTPDIFTVNQLNCTYVPDAYDEEVYNTIVSLAKGDDNITTLLVQMLGYCLMGDCRLQKSFILLGDGRNGKSMFLDMVRCWLGDENCSSLALEDLSERFRTAELVGKMVNIGDDSGHNLLENTAIFKKLVTGDSITIERKNQQPFKYSNKAKLIFAANSLPPTTDKSDGFFRRCIIIPFNQIYRETDKNYDPNKLDKLTTETARSYLLNLAIDGAQTLFEDKRFRIPEDSKIISDYYEVSNNNVLMWYKNIDKEYTSIAKAYGDYMLYCVNSGYKPVSIGKFTGEFNKLKKGFN